VLKSSLLACIFFAVAIPAGAEDRTWRDSAGFLHFSDGTYVKDGEVHRPDGSYSIEKNGVTTHFDKNGRISAYSRVHEGILESFNEKGERTGGLASNADSSRICYDEGQEKRCLIIGPDRVFEVDPSGRLLKENKLEHNRR
jgi:hypothetical protein